MGWPGPIRHLVGCPSRVGQPRRPAECTPKVARTRKPGALQSERGAIYLAHNFAVNPSATQKNGHSFRDYPSTNRQGGVRPPSARLKSKVQGFAVGRWLARLALSIRPDPFCGQISGEPSYDDSEAVRLKKAKNQALRPARPTLPKNVKPGGYDASAATPGAFYPKCLFTTPARPKTPDQNQYPSNTPIHRKRTIRAWLFGQHLRPEPDRSPTSLRRQFRPKVRSGKSR